MAVGVGRVWSRGKTRHQPTQGETSRATTTYEARTTATPPQGEDKQDKTTTHPGRGQAVAPTMDGRLWDKLAYDVVSI